MNERMDTNENRTRILIESICSLTLIIYCALAVTFYKAHVIVRSQNVCHRCIGIVFRSSTRVLLEKYRSIDVQSSSYYSIEQYWPMISKNPQTMFEDSSFENNIALHKANTQTPPNVQKFSNKIHKF